jgi:hypothetical protein
MLSLDAEKRTPERDVFRRIATVGNQNYVNNF